VSFYQEIFKRFFFLFMNVSMWEHCTYDNCMAWYKNRSRPEHTFLWEKYKTFKNLCLKLLKRKFENDISKSYWPQTNHSSSNNANDFYVHENTHNPFLEMLAFDGFRILTNQSLPV
jgi:hypothetical protein